MDDHQIPSEHCEARWRILRSVLDDYAKMLTCVWRKLEDQICFGRWRIWQPSKESGSDSVTKSWHHWFTTSIEERIADRVASLETTLRTASLVCSQGTTTSLHRIKRLSTVHSDFM